LAEAWIAPPEVRELCEVVRYPAKLVALRSGLNPSARGDRFKAASADAWSKTSTCERMTAKG
jgi:hypothetical protein